MKILHICLQAPYNDNWGYQDNLIPKYHRKAGHDVTVITTNTTQTGNRISIVETGDYFLPDGVHIIRLDYVRFFPRKIAAVLKYYRIHELLEELKPDFIMVHGLGNISVLQVYRYVKRCNPKCVVIADNHLDEYNANFPPGRKGSLLIFFYRLLNKKMQKVYSKVFGVTPCRVSYQERIFGIRPSKSGVLVMGGDDDKIHFGRKTEISEDIRKRYTIAEDDFLIITGGKIDEAKNIHLLMQAVNELDNAKVKLLVFGQANESFSATIGELAAGKNIRYIGWIDAEQVYDYFLAANLAVFPGTHSVLWEQACACGIPAVFKKWEGMDHVDVGGNCLFLYQNSSDEIKQVIDKIYRHKKLYQDMQAVSISKGRKTFSYRDIAKRAIEWNYDENFE